MPKRKKPIQNICYFAEENGQGRIKVVLHTLDYEDKQYLPWLFHRVIDLLHEKHLLSSFIGELEECIAALTTDVMSDYITDLLAEAKEAVPAEADEEDEEDEYDEDEDEEDDDEEEPEEELPKPRSAASRLKPNGRLTAAKNG